MMAKPWNEHRETITRLYIQDGRKLEDVRQIMKTEHGFEASTRSYRQHFDMWGLFKYNCKKRDIRRRQQSLARLLPSPPRTPLIPGLPTVEAKIDIGGPVNMPSPESASTRSSISSISSLGSTGRHSPEQRPLPDPQLHRAMGYPPRHPYYETQLSTDSTQEKLAWRQKCLHAMGPPSGVFSEDDLRVALRNPSVAKGMLPTMAINDHSGKPPKYLYQATTYQGTPVWNIPRSHQVDNDNEAHYRLYTTTPRGSQEFLPSSTPRGMVHRTSLPSPFPVPRLAHGRSMSHGTKIKDDPDRLRLEALS